MRVAADRFYPRATLATLAAIAQATAQAQPNGQFTAAQYRDATGVGRSLAIEILEFLDTPRHHAAHRRRAQDAQGFRAHPRRGDRAAATAANAARQARRQAGRSRRGARCSNYRR